MKLKFHMILQALLTAGQIINVLHPVLPEKARVMAVAALPAIQMGVSILNHHFNTNGTPQSEAFRPSDRQQSLF